MTSKRDLRRRVDRSDGLNPADLPIVGLCSGFTAIDGESDVAAECDRSRPTDHPGRPRAVLHPGRPPWTVRGGDWMTKRTLHRRLKQLEEGGRESITILDSRGEQVRRTGVLRPALLPEPRRPPAGVRRRLRGDEARDSVVRGRGGTRRVPLDARQNTLRSTSPVGASPIDRSAFEETRPGRD